MQHHMGSMPACGEAPLGTMRISLIGGREGFDWLLVQHTPKSKRSKCELEAPGRAPRRGEGGARGLYYNPGNN
jgi:hypothetical protein